jgi:glycogen debranching enzyme
LLLPLSEHVDINDEKVKQEFHVLQGKLTKDGAWETYLPEFPPGVINFQLVFLTPGSTKTVRFGTQDSILLCQNNYDLRKLRSMSVFGRCIGPVSEWSKFFKKQMNLGYNAFHLAPIQQTGFSNSYYAIKNQLELDDRLFSGKQKEKEKQMLGVLEPLRKEGVAFIIDIVLNHTSFDSEWIQSSPEAVFTVENTPMLYSAYLVDEAIYEWGQEIKEMMGSDVELTEDILQQIETNLKERINNLELHEYFQLSHELKETMLELLPTSAPPENIFAKDPIESILEFFDAHCTTPNCKPRGIKISDLNAWSGLKNLKYEENDLKIAIQTYNDNWKAKIQGEWVPEIIKNTMGAVRYHYMDAKNRSFDDAYPMVERYFSRVEGKKGSFYALNNGWVGGNNARELFVTSKEYYYFRRRVNAWGDLIRIRYGHKPSDSPVAWDHMTTYVREMAKYFDGFRLDNLHGTPIYLARYMIR